MNASYEAPKGPMTRFRGWLLTGIGAILLALITAWAQYYFGPNSNHIRKVERLDIAGMNVECNVPVSPIMGEDLHVLSKKDCNKNIAFVVVSGYLLQEVLDRGEALKSYSCHFSDKYYVEYRPIGPSYTSSNGQTCRSYYSSSSLIPNDRDHLYIDDSKIRDTLWDACINNKGLWEPTLREELGIRER